MGRRFNPHREAHANSLGAKEARPARSKACPASCSARSRSRSFTGGVPSRSPRCATREACAPISTTASQTERRGVNSTPGSRAARASFFSRSASRSAWPRDRLRRWSARVLLLRNEHPRAHQSEERYREIVGGAPIKLPSSPTSRSHHRHHHLEARQQHTDPQPLPMGQPRRPTAAATANVSGPSGNTNNTSFIMAATERIAARATPGELQQNVPGSNRRRSDGSTAALAYPAGNDGPRTRERPL